MKKTIVLNLTAMTVDINGNFYTHYSLKRKPLKDDLERMILDFLNTYTPERSLELFEDTKQLVWSDLEKGDDHSLPLVT